MAIRNIITKGDEALSKKCKEVVKFDEKLHILLDDMFETMEEYDGVGLAGPQIGMLRRIAIALDMENEEIYELINPEITEKIGSESAVEGCLSIPNVFGYVDRPEEIYVKWQDRNGNHMEKRISGFLARVFCHEIDHLDGILFEGKVTEYYVPSEEDEEECE